MIAVNTCGSTAYRHQFTISKTTTTMSFASMLASGNGKGGTSSDFAGFFSSGDNDRLLSKIYEQMTGQTIGARSGVTTSSDDVELLIPALFLKCCGKADMSRVFNEDSKGDHILSDEEIATLKSKYDINNLSGQERYDLLCDLTDMGVLTSDEARSAGRMITIEETTMSFSFSVIYVNTTAKNGGALLQRLMQMLGKENRDLDSIKDLMKNSDGARYKVAVAKFEASIAQHKKVVNVLEQIYGKTKDKASSGIATLNMAVHGFGGTRINPEIRMATWEDELINGVHPSEMGQLTAYEPGETGELIISKAPDPKYPKSIRDILPSEIEEEFFAARRACSYIDTEGLTQGEIYNRIEQIYKDYLGEDFMEPQILFNGFVSPGSEDYERSLRNAYHEFENQLNRFDVGSRNKEVLIEARGYTGMSKDEMRAAVREQYPERMTLKDCILMAREFNKLGLEEMNYGATTIDRISSTLGMNGQQLQKIYDFLLDMPADFDTMKSSYDNFVKDDYTSYPTYNIDNLLTKLLSWFGGGEPGTQGMMNVLRDMLKDMEAKGELTFDEYGYCRSTKTE